jgi:hypothetical protein
MNDSLTVSKADLQRAFLEWATKSRAGTGFRTDEESRALPVEQVVSENTDYVWSLLNTPSPTTTAKVSL